MQPAINRALAACDLVTSREQAGTTLSGGEFARAMLARAIVGDPHILIVDEPITGLDPRHAMASHGVAVALCARSGTLVIASLHDLTLAARHATRIVALVDGGLWSTRFAHRRTYPQGVWRALPVSGKGDSLAFTLLSPSEK